MIIQAVLISLSLVLTLLFFLYGYNHYYLINTTRFYKSPAPPDQTLARPGVSIHLPVYNERYVVRRLVAACAIMAQAYGIEKVHILILDDSDDDTSLEVDKVIKEYLEKQFHIEVLRRENRDGFKSRRLEGGAQPDRRGVHSRLRCRLRPIRGFPPSHPTLFSPERAPGYRSKPVDPSQSRLQPVDQSDRSGH